jgi:hypothetical protein
MQNSTKTKEHSTPSNRNRGILRLTAFLMLVMFTYVALNTEE